MQNMCAVHGPMPRTRGERGLDLLVGRRPSVAKSIVPSRVLSTRSNSDRRFGPADAACRERVVARAQQPLGR